MPRARFWAQLFLCSVVGALAPAIAGAAEAFRPGAVWQDDHNVPINAHGGGLLEREGTYYWFGEHKIPGPAGNDAHVGVHVYSSKNLYHWRDEGIALKVSTDPKNDLAEGCILERPKVIYCRKTGRYVMWFHLEPKGMGYGAARSGVAMASQPAGPYEYVRSFRPDAGVWPANVADGDKKLLTEAEANDLRGRRLPGGPVANFPANLVFRRDFAGGQMARDMTLFMDDDGAAYQIYASEENGTLHISQLRDDFMGSRGRYARVFPGGFNEAPALFKHQGKYYLITSACTGWTPNSARMAAADSIWGPWITLGNPCAGAGAETTFGGQPTYVLPVSGRAGQFIFMADRWRPENAIDGRYLWLPIQFKATGPVIAWRDEWTLEAPEK